ncbi:MAG TPA: methionyl-tRNA formyltransferase [Treponemataceae bacterium]|nr:methionyl-tRNA formyltransferase [Treponemataceae bacterium]
MLRIVYAGCPDISARVLRALSKDNSFEIVGVLTNPPSAKGRHKKRVPTPVAQLAEELDILVISPEHLTLEVREKITALNPDLLVCFSYGKIFGPKFLALFPKGGVNVHPSLLPRWRGCAPVSAAILAQNSETGISVQRVAQKMDTGDILMQKRIPLDGTETTASFLESIVEQCGKMLLKVLKQIDSGSEKGVVQNEEQASYSSLLKKEDGCIDWSKSAAEVSAKIRAYNPWPGAFTCAGGDMLRIHYAEVFKGVASDVCAVSKHAVSENAVPGTVICADRKNGILIQCGSGIVCAKKLQWHTKKAMDWKNFLNGARNFAGTCCYVDKEGKK